MSKLIHETGAAPWPLFQLFVYGTLKRNFRNHPRFCAHAAQTEAAVVWGRIHRLRDGYPALVIPSECILANGTLDPERDASLQRDGSAFGYITGDWDLIEGELMSFSDPRRDIPPIDRLECFRPNRLSIYHRALILCKTDTRVTTAWTYHCPKLGPDTRLDTTNWIQDCPSSRERLKR